MRTFLAMAACLLAVLTGCSGSSHPVRPYGAQGAGLGESLSLLGWNMAVSNLRKPTVSRPGIATTRPNAAAR